MPQPKKDQNLGLLVASTRRWVIALGVVSIAAVILSYFFVDRPLTLWSHDLPRPARHFFSGVTKLGDATIYYVIFGALAIYFAVRRQIDGTRWMLFGLLCLAVAAGAINNLIKMVVGRYRPKLLFDDGAWGFDFFRYGYEYNSFPSGHACSVAVAATVMWLIKPRWWPLWLAIAAPIAVSRVFAHAHYLSDVIAGAYLGALVTLLLHAWLCDKPEQTTVAPESETVMASEKKTPARHTYVQEPSTK